MGKTGWPIKPFRLSRYNSADLSTSQISGPTVDSRVNATLVQRCAVYRTAPPLSVRFERCSSWIAEARLTQTAPRSAWRAALSARFQRPRQDDAGVVTPTSLYQGASVASKEGAIPCMAPLRPRASSLRQARYHRSFAARTSVFHPVPGGQTLEYSESGS